jgi:guanine nucleotide-binding protein subunit beta-2-like 1 protein
MVESTPAPEFKDLGYLEGHNGWVTSIVSGHSQKENEDSNVLISGSRDKTLMIWDLSKSSDSNEATAPYGAPLRSLTGHNHFVSDLCLSNDNAFCISSSWDKTLRLWDLKTGKTSRTFEGHSKEVFSVTFSPDNRQIISAGADRVVKLWNTLADNKFNTEQSNHTDWVSCLRYSPNLKAPSKAPQFAPYFASVGWDGRLKIWNTTFQIKYTFKAHQKGINSLSISPNGRYLATGGKDMELCVWDIMDLNESSRSFDVGAPINQVAFNPKFQWVAAATDNGVKIWDLMNDDTKPLFELYNEHNKTESKKKQKPKACVSLCWTALGKKLFAGFTDGLIKVWKFESPSEASK